jgi:hypothetical protein
MDENSLSLHNISDSTEDFESSINPLQAAMNDLMSADAPAAINPRNRSVHDVVTDLQTRRGADDDVLGALRIAFEPSILNQFFPMKFEEFLLTGDPRQLPCY